MATRSTIKDIRLAYSDDKKSKERAQIWLYFVARNISFYSTLLFLRLGVSANQATHISTVVGSLGCVLLAFGSYAGRIVGALLINLWIVLDCTDGNIARLHKSSSPYGSFIDALGGYVLTTLLFISAGISVFNSPEPLVRSLPQHLPVSTARNVFLACGFWCSCAALLLMLIHHKFIDTFSRKQDILRSVHLTRYIFRGALCIVQNLTFVSSFLLPILLVATLFRCLSLFVLFYSVVNSSVLLCSTALFISKAKSLSE